MASYDFYSAHLPLNGGEIKIRKPKADEADAAPETKAT